MAAESKTKGLWYLLALGRAAKERTGEGGQAHRAACAARVRATGASGTRPFRDAEFGKMWPRGGRLGTVARAGVKLDPQVREHSHCTQACPENLQDAGKGSWKPSGPPGHSTRPTKARSCPALPCPALLREPPTAEVSWSMGPTPGHLPRRVPSSPEHGPGEPAPPASPLKPRYLTFSLLFDL